VVARQVTPAPDQTLASILRAQTGDAAAFSDLVQKHERVIYNLALSIVRNAEDAADIVQDVWVRVARHLPQLREPERFGPWLYRIARNCSMDFYNARRAQPQADRGRDDQQDDAPFDVPDSQDYAPEEQLLSLDERRKVWEALV
jgi:RNA polymerase sigma-70 factor, ECF subfamily